MRLLLIIILFFTLLAIPVMAEEGDASVFSSTDVHADVTATSSAKARDEAITAAQRAAFHQLLERLGARASFGATFNDDDIATLVQSFEVQDEHTSSVRYIGTFIVQFKPNAVRSMLATAGVGYTETRGKLAVVIPLYTGGDKPVLWEDSTKWRTAWEKSSPMNGLVPVVVPVGDHDDSNVLSAVDAANGRGSSIKTMIERYQAGEAIVATLESNIDKPGNALALTITRYDNDGDGSSPQHLTVPVPDGKNGLDLALADAVRQARGVIDSEWRSQTGSSDAPPETSGTSLNTATPAPVPEAESTVRLPVSVPIKSLSDWAAIKRRLDSVPVIAHTDVIMLQRGSTSIEIEFRGDIPHLQDALRSQSLRLVQDLSTNAWVLQATGEPL